MKYLFIILGLMFCFFTAPYKSYHYGHYNNLFMRDSDTLFITPGFIMDSLVGAKTFTVDSIQFTIAHDTVQKIDWSALYYIYVCSCSDTIGEERK